MRFGNRYFVLDRMISVFFVLSFILIFNGSSTQAADNFVELYRQLDRSDQDLDTRLLRVWKLFMIEKRGSMVYRLTDSLDYGGELGMKTKNWIRRMTKASAPMQGGTAWYWESEIIKLAFSNFPKTRLTTEAILKERDRGVRSMAGRLGYLAGPVSFSLIKENFGSNDRILKQESARGLADFTFDRLSSVPHDVLTLVKNDSYLLYFFCDHLEWRHLERQESIEKQEKRNKRLAEFGIDCLNAPAP